VKPDATPEEVKAVVNDEQGGQIFSQAVCIDIFIVEKFQSINALSSS
jgi:hypothetical protein